MYQNPFVYQLIRLQSILTGLKSWVRGQLEDFTLRDVSLSRMEQRQQPLEVSSAMVTVEGVTTSLTYVQELQLLVNHHIQLREVICRIHRSLATDDLACVVVYELLQFFQADWVCLLEKGPRHWHSLGTSGNLTGAEHSSVLYDYLNLDAVRAQLCQLHPIVVDAQSIEQLLAGHPPVETPGSWLLVPVHWSAASRQPGLVPQGLVAIGRYTQTSKWSPQQQEQARILAQEIGVVLDHRQRYTLLKQDNQTLKALALTDSLTGLANRRWFDSHFNTEWQRLAREEHPLTLILCDIDYFKRYNDYYGHPAGDTCLTQVSQILNRCMRRPADLAARYGGEEFALILPNTDTPGGHSVALEIQTQLAQLSIPHATSEVASSVTFTMGMATVLPKDCPSPYDLLQAADLALYHAKQQGRDRIYVHAHYCIPNDNVTLEAIPKET